MPNGTLFELTDKILWVEEFLEQLEEEGAEVPAEEFLAKVSRFLDDTDEARKEKLDGYAWLIRKWTMEGEAAREIAREWDAKARAREARVQRMKDTLEAHMQAVKQDKIETSHWTFRRQKNAQPELNIEFDKLPIEALVYPEPRPDKKWIQEALKEGREVPGVTIGETKYHLRIK